MTKPKTRESKTATDRPWYRQVTTGYVVWWDDDYMTMTSDEEYGPCRDWAADKKAATKFPRATAFAIARWIRKEFDAKKVRVLRRHKVVP